MTSTVNIAAMRLERSTSALANGVELAVNVVRAIAGNDVANTLHGESVTQEAASRLIIARVQKKLETASA